MHTVTCPKCNKMLRIPKAVSNARIRCIECAAEFTASSVPMVIPTPTPPARPETPAAPRAPRTGKPRLYHSTRKAPVPPVVVVAGGVGIVGVIVLAIVCAYVASSRSNDKKVVRDDTESPARRSGTSAPSVGDSRGNPGGTKVAGGGQPTPNPRGGNGTLPPDSAGQGGTNLPKQDEKIRVEQRSQLDDYDNMTVWGEVRNLHKYPVRQVVLTFIIPDASGAEVLAKQRVVCNHIPAQGTVGFRVKLGALPEGTVPKVIATSAPEPRGTVCWRIDTSDVRLNAESVPRSVVLAGRVRNQTDTTVTEVELHCDFFSRGGYYHSTAVGKLTKAFRIEPGAEASYRVVLPNVMSAAAISKRTILRLVGRVAP